MKKQLFILLLIVSSCNNSIDYDSPEHLEECPESAYGDNGPHDWDPTVVLDDMSCTYKCKKCGRLKILDDTDIATYSSVTTGKLEIKYDYVKEKLVN